ncbi:MAG: radical SAM protein [Euryarchaeota archaeon]|nr:radical SAM protein [Euryarchaeota archaeon]
MKNLSSCTIFETLTGEANDLVISDVFISQQKSLLTPEDHMVEIIEEKFNKINFDKGYDLVGISCFTCNVKRGYEIADKFRCQGIPVVLGGYHPSALPLEAKTHADSVVIGEAELVWPQLLIDLENKTLKPFYKSNKYVDPKFIPPAKRINQRNPIFASIQASRGCPNSCKFCAMHNIEGPQFRPRCIDSIIDEIRSIKCKNLFFVDSSLTINPRFSKSLFKEMIGLNKKFECFGNMNVLTKDDELLDLASKAGCIRWLVGIESISQETIDSMKKGTNKVKEYEIAIQKIKDHGMLVTGLFMFGFDNDTPDIFNRTLQAMNELNLDSASFSIVTPYPGTQLFNEMEAEGRILTKDWAKYTEGNVVFKPKNMSEEELLQGIKKAAMKYYSFSCSLRRCLRSKNLSFNLILKKVSRNFFYTKLFYKELFNL